MNNFIVSSTPHIRRNFSMSTIMLFMILALVPSMICSILFFGLRAFLILAISTICCYLFDVGFSYIVYGKYDHRNISCLVTGIILGLCMPVGMNLAYVVIASFVSIFVGKILFGGEGKALVCEAALGVALLAGILGGFSTTLCSYTISGESLVSPLSFFANGDYTSVPILSLFIGNGGGLIGTSSAMAALIGGILLCSLMIYDFYIPVVSIAGFIITIIVTKGTTAFIPEVFAGSFLFVSFFMLPSHSSSPTIWISKLLYALVFGVLAALTRSQYILGEAGIFFCLLLVNLLTPIFDWFFGIFYRGRGIKRYE